MFCKLPRYNRNFLSGIGNHKTSKRSPKSRTQVGGEHRRSENVFLEERLLFTGHGDLTYTILLRLQKKRMNVVEKMEAMEAASQRLRNVEAKITASQGSNID